MNRPAVFFDRDNTLIASDGYLGDPAGVVLVAGAAAAIARLAAKGFAIVTFSNQSGVARGMFSESAVHAVNARLDELLRQENPAAIIDRHEFCPYHPEATVERYKQDSELRKPKPGMIVQAAEQLKIDRAISWVIGDAPRDITAGHAAGCRTILFTDPSLKKSSAAEDALEVEPDFTATTLEDAVDIIEKNTVSETETETETETPAEPTEAATENDPTAIANDPPAGASASSGRKLTFAERVRAGIYQPARAGVAPGVAVAERPKRTPGASAESQANSMLNADETAPSVKPTEPLDQAELIEPLLQQMLEELRLLRQQSHRGNEYSVTKLLAGIVQVLVIPSLFFAYLNRGVPADLQSLLLLATFLQTATIALLIMGRQS
jgi:histidinol-phosphate phosphatase family protein